MIRSPVENAAVTAGETRPAEGHGTLRNKLNLTKERTSRHILKDL